MCYTCYICYICYICYKCYICYICYIYLGINSLWASTLSGHQQSLGISPLRASTLSGNQPSLGINPLWASSLSGHQQVMSAYEDCCCGDILRLSNKIQVFRQRKFLWRHIIGVSPNTYLQTRNVCLETHRQMMSADRRRLSVDITSSCPVCSRQKDSSPGRRHASHLNVKDECVVDV